MFVKKRVLIIVTTTLLILTIPLLLFYHSLNGWPWYFWGWQTVTVEGVGEFKVPGNWVVTRDGNAICFTDKAMDEEGYLIYLAGVVNIYAITVCSVKADEFGSITMVFSNKSELHVLPHGTFNRHWIFWDYLGDMDEECFAIFDEGYDDDD